MTAQVPQPPWNSQQPAAGENDPVALRRRISSLEEALAETGLVEKLRLPLDHPDITLEILQAYRGEMLRRGARRHADKLEAADSWQPPEATGDLAAELALPRQTYAYRIPGYAGWNHDVLLAGPRKTGKSQLGVNLSASLSLAAAWTAQQGRWVSAKFLGLSECYMAGNLAYVNLEMDEDDWRDTFRALPPGSFDATRIFPLHRRGLPLPVITNPSAREWLAAWLRERSVEVLIIDTWGALCAKNGVRNFNDDAEARVVLDGLDEIKAAAGVASAMVLIHMPHQVPGMKHLERFKGAGAVGDWADALWSYVQDEEGTRYLSAVGRARIDAAEQSLAYDGGTGQLSWGGTGSRAQTSASRQRERMLAALEIAGGKGMLTTDLMDAAGGHTDTARKAAKAMEEDGRLVTEEKGR